MSLTRPEPRGLAARIFAAGPEARLALLRACWRLAVGDDLARRTEVLAIEGETLRLRVPDARWWKVLHRMERDILWRFRSAVGELAPKRLGFTEGPVATDVAVATAPAPPESKPRSSQLVESAASIADPELRACFLATVARYLSRAHSRGEDENANA
jgi:hypothetical protein